MRQNNYKYKVQNRSSGLSSLQASGLVSVFTTSNPSHSYPLSEHTSIFLHHPLLPFMGMSSLMCLVLLSWAPILHLFLGSQVLPWLNCNVCEGEAIPILSGIPKPCTKLTEHWYCQYTENPKISGAWWSLWKHLLIHFISFFHSFNR